MCGACLFAFNPFALLAAVTLRVSQDSVNGTVGESVLLAASYTVSDPGGYLRIRWTRAGIRAVDYRCISDRENSLSGRCHYLPVPGDYKHRVVLFPENASLLLQHLHHNDSGIYELSVSHSEGTETAKITLMVQNTTGCGMDTNTKETPRAEAKIRYASLIVILIFLCFTVKTQRAGEGDVLAAIGSSVLLDPGHGANLSHSQVEWTFIGSDGKLVTILDYVPNSPIQKPNEAFKSRLHFNASNGSVTLTNLKPSDQGVYTITVGSNWKRSMDLKLIEPMPEPLIKATCMASAVELICLVTAGKASSILWKKGPDVIKNSQHYQLVQNNSKLVIVKATETDSGIYTCIVENMLSKNSNAHSLILHDVPLLLNCAKILSIAALVTAVVTLICKIIEFFIELKTRSKQKQGLQLHQNLLQILQFLLLIGAFGCWISTEGPTKITVIVLMFLLLLLAGIVSSTWCITFYNTKKFSKIYIAKHGKWRNWTTGNPSATGREPDEHCKQFNEPFLKHTDDEQT
ncbi:hypothetical protein chiPu_0020483 [Chiloscyllium punctatum]|uniref:Ig-like domain-containing protein n=1 Tax=Chiloscyllium punctatum TaxID=137246 RepID=A0A401RG54_CHIPU|nr:hypothetical protein [Chiloscyllium punctatum]